MTPKKKAEELVLKYLRIDNDTEEWFHKGLAKQCALIAVDEIFEFMKMDDDLHEDVHFVNSIWVQYWQQVKQEIENL